MAERFSDKIIRLRKYILRFGVLTGAKIFSRINSKKEIITVKPGNILYPLSLRNNLSDILTFEQIFIKLEYNIDIPIVPENIIDCGANIGLTTVYLKNRYPSSTIIAIEPDAGNFALLKKNTSQYVSVHCLNNGAWNKSTNLEVVDKLNVGPWAFETVETNQKTATTVQSITITEIMQQFDLNEIDLLKIDIEGAEKELFSDNYEYWLPKTKVLYIELHDRYRKGTSASFFQAISKYDFCVYPGKEILICIRN